MLGQDIKLSRLVNSEKRCVIAALDAGGFFGPYEGLINILETCNKLFESDAILLEPGFIEKCRDVFLSNNAPILITRLNWNTDYCFQWNYSQSRIVKSLSPEHALLMGAEAGIASLSINTGNEEIDSKNIEIFTEIIEEAQKTGLPIIGEIYPPIKEYKDGQFYDLIYKSCRIAAELGANAIKTFYTKNGFSEIIKALPIPVLALGGDKKETDLESLIQAEKSVREGASGVVFGRNLYQARNPELFLKALKEVINLNVSAEEAVKKYNL